jgi:hypothetical protein
MQISIKIHTRTRGVKMNSYVHMHIIYFHSPISDRNTSPEKILLDSIRKTHRNAQQCNSQEFHLRHLQPNPNYPNLGHQRRAEKGNKMPGYRIAYPKNGSVIF